MNQTQQASRTRVVVATKDVVASCFEEFRQELQRVLDQGCDELVIDLSSVQIVDSRGLALFMLCQKSLAGTGGRLRLVTQNQDLRQLFHVMRLDRHMTVSDQV